MVDIIKRCEKVGHMKPAPSAQIVLSPCQIVSWNLKIRRQARGWSQVEMAKRLEPYIGYRISRAALSKAERHKGGPTRRWNADEIFALARIFETPVGNFFLPPQSVFNGKKILVNGIPGDPKARVSSPSVSYEQAIDLAMYFESGPLSKAERKRQEAFAMKIVELTQSAQNAAYGRVLGGYLRAHPGELRELLTEGIPPSVLEAIIEVSSLNDLIPVRKQKLADQAVEIDRKLGPASTRSKR